MKIKSESKKFQLDYPSDTGQTLPPTGSVLWGKCTHKLWLVVDGDITGRPERQRILIDLVSGKYGGYLPAGKDWSELFEDVTHKVTAHFHD